MKRFWLSFHQPTPDYRPLTYPPNEAILGWWCSGYDENDIPVICALVRAESEQAAQEAVLKDWPEAERYRFCYEVEPGWMPNDRFPIPEWGKERINAEAASR